MWTHPMKHLHKILAAKTLLYSLSLFLMLATSSLAQEINRNIGGQGVNSSVDVSVHPEVTGQPPEQPSKSRTAAPASTFGATRSKPLSATTGSGIAPKAQAPLTQPLNSTSQGASSETQTNAATGVKPPPTPQKHIVHSSVPPAAASTHFGFAATQPHLGGLQSGVHHSSGKRSTHGSSKLFTAQHKSLGQGIPAKSRAHHSPKSKLD
jgi:hypothetical protein